MLRWIGAALVVLCSAMLSMNEVIRSRQRIRALHALLDALGAMRAELAQRRTPMPELLEHLTARQRQPAAEFFGTAAVNLIRRELPFSTAWEMALRETEPLCLLPEELAEKKLALFLELEERERMKKNRLRAALGAGAGAMLAILLL